ncbi:hypothetical protein DEO72_LG3g1894 [Vigna unguiculata]|uniref:Uncharacterized protein n=1 Tax=Vigna unguiculata TaxID=3917 RepID=A0A4D6LFS6_VIGUN|nr:hypothetical protein DEO72_LG3g1894 [Vigna unguiculata]
MDSSLNRSRSYCVSLFAPKNPTVSPFPASMSRLGEINRGCPSCFTQAVAQATHVLFERVSVSSKREGSRLSEIPREATVPLFEPSPRRGGIA